MAPSAHISHCVRINGAVNQQDLQTALAKTLYSHALLNSRIELTPAHAYYVPSCGDGVELTVEPWQGPDQWLQGATREQARAIALETGPLFRCVLLAGSECSDLICSFHHVLFDGTSLIQVVRTLLHYLAEPGAPVEHAPAREVDVNQLFERMPPRGDKAERGIVRFNRFWKAHEKRFTWAEYHQMFADYWKAHPPVCVVRFMDKGDVTSLLAKCHEHHTTIGGALLAACALAQHEVQGDFKGSEVVTLAFDMRRSLPPADQDTPLGFGSGVPVYMEVSDDTDLWELAASSIDAARREIDAPHDTSGIALADTYVDAIPFILYGYCKAPSARLALRFARSGEETTAMNVVNLGTRDLPMAFGPYTAQWHAQTPAKFISCQKTINAMTVGGTMQLGLTCDSYMLRPGVAAKILSAALRILQEA
jgi:hypothetical protein